MTTSFGEYFDAQRDRMIKDMQNKNTQLNIEWRERYEERKKQEKERAKELLESAG